MDKSLYRILVTQHDNYLYADFPIRCRYVGRLIKEYYLNKLPKEKTFDSMANSLEESKRNVKIYNNLLKRIKTIIERG